MPTLAAVPAPSGLASRGLEDEFVVSALLEVVAQGSLSEGSSLRPVPTPRTAPTYDALVTRMAALQKHLKRKKLTVASAESCTGGLLAAVLSDSPGSSDHYLGGAVVYANEAKTAFADVAPDLIHGHGAVSPVVAAALARGVRGRLGAKIGLGITGIAGPAGATPGKPVGLTFVAIDSDGESAVKRFTWPFDRAGNRLASVGAALDLLEEMLG
jgi:PncC family amidohydrolase